MSPRLLLLTGAPASGKTQLASRLVQRYRACQISKDEFKEVLFDTLGTHDAQWSRRLSDASFALLFRMTPRLLTGARPLLLEGNFRRGEHETALTAVLAGSGAELAQILCQAPIATRVTRLAARGADPTRHPGHHDRDFDPAAAAAAEFLDLPGPRWSFSSETEADGSWQALCREMDRWCGPPRPPVAKQ